MQPSDNTPPKPLYVPPRQPAPIHDREARPAANAQNATANITRSQIDAIFANDPNSHMAAPAPTAEPATQQATPAPAPAPARAEPLPTITRSFTPEKEQETQNPYARTHDESKLHADKADWQKYHSAWQDYYQQYFHRYYAQHVQSAHSKLAEQSARLEALENQPSQPQQQQADDALTGLRSEVRSKVEATAKNVRKSRHFVPAVAGVIVMLVFAFLQYNSVLFANVEAYISPASTEPTNLIVSPSSTVAADGNPRLLIPKIAVDVPVIWNATPDHDSQMAAMKKGVAWFNIKGANAQPGEIGNTVLSGHSSNDVFDDGDYKFVFARLEQLSKGDTIYVNNKGIRYTYVISETRVVKPTQVDALTAPVDKPVLTLITCTPLGTATNRLLVIAEQISPNPNEATKPAEDTSQDDASMPGNAPTFFERLFGAE
jgi:sortase A